MLPNIEFSILLSPLLHDQKAVSFRKHQVIFSQGAPSDSMFYIERGTAKLTVTSAKGKEALIDFFNKGAFFGESCRAPDRPTRFHTATALTNIHAVKLDGNEIKTILRTNAQLAYAFVAYLLRRNAQIQGDLANNLLDSSEERLGRVLSSLSRLRRIDKAIPRLRLSLQDLANTIGVSRQRVNVLMKRFRNQIAGLP